MIQRIQTLFLLLAVICIGALAVAPFLSMARVPEGSIFFADRIFDVHDHFLFMVLFGLGGLLALVSIFLFGNRKRQLQVNSWSRWSVLLGFAIAFSMLLVHEGSNLSGGFKVGVGLLLPPAFWIFSVLATRNIKNDEKLVRSMDRLR